MKLYKPTLKRRSDGSQPKKNNIFGDFENLFDSYEDKLSFHFFSDQDGLKHKKAWKILLNETDNFDKKNVSAAIIEVEGRNLIESNVRFLSSKDIELEYIIFKDNLDWTTHNGLIYKIKFYLQNDIIMYQVRSFSRDGFRKYLFELQGESMVMNKKLLYSNTELEGYLSDLCYRNNPQPNTAIFPGDIDLLIYDELRSLYVLEFKKHNIKGPIEEQSFLKYIYNDRKKYMGIASVAIEFGHDFFYNIIYSTNQDLNKIKIEKIDVNLNLLSDQIFEFNTKKELESIFNKIFTL